MATSGILRFRRASIGMVALVMIAAATGLPASAGTAQPPPPSAPVRPPVIPEPAPASSRVSSPPIPGGPVRARANAGEEIIDRRTERSKTFATDRPGQYRTELYPERVHYRDATGAYRPIDSDLAASSQRVRRSKANSFTLELADDANAAAIANIRLDEAHSVGFALEGAAAVTARTDARTSTYARARTGVDVRLSSRAEGLKEELVLSSLAAGSRFVFPLALNGLNAAIDDSGDVVYRDAAGTERARTPHGFMTDSAIDPRSGEPALSTGVTYALIPHPRGSALEVRLDRAWLADPARVWPVIVDPQIAVATFADDTYVMSGFHRDSSHDLELKVGTYDGGAHVGRSYMRFDTSAINNKTLNWAQLHIAERHSWNCASAWPSVHRVTAPWNGADLRDWPGAPFDANPAGAVVSANGSCNGRTVVYDVTSAAAHWAANPSQSYGLALATSASDNNAWKKFASSETGAPPALHVNWNEPPPPPTGNATGYFEGVYPIVGGARAIGWAMDPDTPASPIAVHVYIDNNVFVEALLAKAYRPDVGAVFPAYGNFHGFDDFVPMAPGPHTVCVYAVNVGAGSAPVSATGCRSVVVPARGPNEPLGSMDGATPSPGGVGVHGWALDPDTVAPIGVQVWSDVGYVTTLTANTSRSDIGSLYPGYGNNHGFNGFVNLSPGYHNVCVFAINTAAGTNHPLLGCRQVNIGAANPPSAPTNATASTSSANTAQLSWTPSATDGGSPIDYYAAYAYDAATATYAEQFRVVYTATCGASCSATSFTDLPGDRSYYFAVYAHNGSPVNYGFSGVAISNTITVSNPPPPTTPPTTSPPPTTTPPPGVPSPPLSVQATAGHGSATITWSPPEDLNGSRILTYVVEVVGEPDCVCTGIYPEGTETSTVVTGLTNGREYTFRVSTSSSNGPGEVSDPSNTVLPIRELRVMSWNLKRLLEGSTLAQIAERIEAHDIDVVGLQEVTSSQAADLATILDWDSYYIQAKDPSDEPPLATEVLCAIDFAPRCVPFGNAIISRFPMPEQNRQAWQLPPTEPELGIEYRQLMRARIVVDGLTFHLYNTHLAARPNDDEPGGPAGREEQAQAVLDVVDADRTSASMRFRAVLACDCNSDPEDPAMTTLRSGFLDTWEAKGVGSGRTSVDNDRRIDYVLVHRDSDLSIDAAEVDFTPGLSDHYPVWTVL